MRVSSFATALIAFGITAVAAVPSYGRPQDLKAKTLYYKQLAKLMFFGDYDEERCQGRGHTCCKSFNKYEDEDTYQGIECYYARPSEDCRDVTGRSGFTKGCCVACTKSFPAYCMQCYKLD